MRKSQRRNTNNSSSFGSLWIITGSLILLFIGGLHYLKNHSIEPTKTAAAIKHKKASTNAATTPTPVAAAEPQFDFYTILPQSKVERPKPLPTPQPAAAAKPTTSNINANNTTNAVKAPTNHFMLQVASVKDLAVADQLKAELTLLGFDVTLQKVKAGKIVWNRVNLGPYNTSDAAQADQQRLKKNNISSILVKLK